MNDSDTHYIFLISHSAKTTKRRLPIVEKRSLIVWDIVPVCPNRWKSRLARILNFSDSSPLKIFLPGGLLNRPFLEPSPTTNSAFIPIVERFDDPRKGPVLVGPGSLSFSSLKRVMKGGILLSPLCLTRSSWVNDWGSWASVCSFVCLYEYVDSVGFRFSMTKEQVFSDRSMNSPLALKQNVSPNCIRTRSLESLLLRPTSRGYLFPLTVKSRSKLFKHYERFSWTVEGSWKLPAIRIQLTISKMTQRSQVDDRRRPRNNGMPLHVWRSGSLSCV